MIEALSEKNLNEANAFLSKHEETAQFLINNLSAHGHKLSEHPNSGNFKMLRKSGSVVGVFSLTRRGNLIIESVEDESELILKECLNEAIKINGFIGNWPSVEPLYKLFKNKNPDFKPVYESKEILYSYLINSSDEKIQRDPRVRLLQIEDFSQWLNFSKAYMEELSLPEKLTKEEIRIQFETQINNKVWWGLFDGQKLLSRAGLNSKGETVGQVGGVFTPKEFRKKGYSKATMFHMLKDCLELHHHKKSILFTAQNDIPAQKLYESMGYFKIGFFALILGG